MNWPQFFKQWGEQAERLRQMHAEQQATNKRLASLETQLLEAKTIAAQVKGAYKGAVAVGSLIGALVVIAARLASLWLQAT
jgi:hypothetical protein